ncbi:vegetative incompatibility protein het-e-1 [Mariannaea sp. PMI_226]|nr:vegetative incompatibility protein het-e-1 [Mariannaea sp. PMI_226]
MDPISLTASLIAFLQITDSVIKACKHCIDTIKDAPKDMEMILGEVMSLRAIIHGLSNTNLPSSTPSLFAQSGPVEACRRCLCALEGLVTPDDKNQKASQSKFRLKLADLSWPLKEPKARKLIAEMSQHKSTLLLAMTGDIIYDIKAIKSGVERLGRTLTDAQRQDLIQWVERTNPSSIHNAVFRKHERHTSAWLLQSSEWLTWLDNTEPARFLWIHGIPGSGKTVMASFIIENIRQLCDSDDELGHAYYYCHYSHDQDEAIPFLRWIIGKLCRQAKWVPPRLQSLHEDGSDPSIPQLEDVLGDLAEKFNTIYLVIDGVDESNPRDDLLAVVVTIAVDKRFKNIRILATSRVYFDIERMFSGISTAISMSNPLVDKDIREFVRAKLSSNYLLKRWAPIMGSIEDALVAGARGM